MTELGKRVLFGAPAATLFLVLTWLGGIEFLILTAAIALIIIFEMVHMFENLKYPAILPLSLALGVYLWTMPLLPEWIVLSVATLLLLMTSLAVIIRSKAASIRWLASLFCGLYGPVGLLFFYQVRLISPVDTGLWFALALILMIWGNDICAYFGGRSFGKTPLAPRISPNKTWEGFWSGFAGAVLGLVIVYFIADPFPLDFFTALPMAVLISIFGPLGDLSASRLKRLSGVKDSSGLLPGHGGFLDRFDALIFCAPVVYLYLVLVWRVG